MSFWTSLQSFFMTTEQDVVALVGKIKTEVTVLEKDAQGALQWLANNTPAIAQDLATATNLALQVGVATNPEVAAAIKAANLAVTALNAFASANKSGQSSLQAVVDGYVALKQAQSASASAVAAAAGAK